MKHSFYSVIVIILATLCMISISAAEMTLTIEQDTGRHLYPSIRKITNTLYSSRIPEKNLTLVMERIDARTQPLWEKYISVQSSNCLFVNDQKKEGSTARGSFQFGRVLNQVSYIENEMWVAYITKTDKPKAISDSMRWCSEQNVIQCSDPFAKDIEMFMTVTSSPKALITSHMGIASSVEGVKNRTKGTSIDLHSFAAKVMLMRNPRRRFMVTAPVYAMEKIMTEALPHSVYIGTRELQKALKERQNLTFEEFKATNTHMIGALLTELRKEAHQNSEKYDEEKIALNLVEALVFRYKIFKNLSYTRDYQITAEEFLNLTEKHPPLVSVNPVLIFDPVLCVDSLLCIDQKNNYFSKDLIVRHTLTLFDPEKPSEPWLSIADSNKDYQWIFNAPFIPTSSTHYFAVKLADLANCRPVE